MRRLVSALVLCCASCGDDPRPPGLPLPAADPAPAWAVSGGNGASQFAYGVALGPDLVVATGSFGGSLDLGRGRLESADGTTSGWVAAFDRKGRPRWTFSLSSTKDAAAGAVAIGAHVFVGGRFSGALTVGGRTVTSAGADDAFLLELEPSGEVVRLDRFGDEQWQSISGVVVDDEGVTVAGDFGGSVFGLASAGGQDAFVARLEGGAVRWSARFGADGDELRPRIARAGADTVVAASYQGSFAFAGTTLPERLDGMVVFRLDEAGTPRWARGFVGTKWQYPAAVAVADDGRLGIGGRFAGSFVIGETPLESTSGEDAFVCTFAPDGTPDRAARFGGFGPDAIGGVAFSRDDLFVAGDFSTALGPLRSAGASDVFVARLDRDLALRWSLRLGDGSEQHATKLAVDDGSVAVVGSFFGDIVFGATRLRSNGGFEPEGGDAFLALFSR